MTDKKLRMRDVEESRSVTALQPDRIKYSYGLTLSLGEKSYEFARFDVGMESTVMAGETSGDTLQRIVDFVDEQVNEMAGRVIGERDGKR